MNYKVDLCVYDISDFNSFCYPLGLGAFHSCIQVNNREYSYGSINFKKRLKF